MATPREIKVALCYHPNPLHSGLIYAQAQGYYKAAGLDVILVSPKADNYATTPCKKLSKGEVNFALCPTESIVSWQARQEPVNIKACAAIINREASVIASKTAKRPAEMAQPGKKYASYAARFEDAIVQDMVNNDASEGEIKAAELDCVSPAASGVWSAVINGDCDSTWIFAPYEGVQAQRAGATLSTFEPAKYGIPYGYPMCLAYNADIVRDGSEDEAAYKAFLTATARGYEDVAKDINETALLVQGTMLKDNTNDPRDTDLEFLKEATKAFVQTYNIDSEGRWGRIDGQIIENFALYLQDKGRLKTRDGTQLKIDPANLYTNALLA